MLQLGQYSAPVIGLKRFLSIAPGTSRSRSAPASPRTAALLPRTARPACRSTARTSTAGAFFPQQRPQLQDGADPLPKAKWCSQPTNPGGRGTEMKRGATAAPLRDDSRARSERLRDHRNRAADRAAPNPRATPTRRPRSAPGRGGGCGDEETAPTPTRTEGSQPRSPRRSGPSSAPRSERRAHLLVLGVVRAEVCGGELPAQAEVRQAVQQAHPPGRRVADARHARLACLIHPEPPAMERSGLPAPRLTCGPAWPAPPPPSSPPAAPLAPSLFAERLRRPRAWRRPPAPIGAAALRPTAGGGERPPRAGLRARGGPTCRARLRRDAAPRSCPRCPRAPQRAVINSCSEIVSLAKNARSPIRAHSAVRTSMR